MAISGRSWPLYSGGSFDQIGAVVRSIRETPDSRRHNVSAWNVQIFRIWHFLHVMCFFQFYVAGDRLSCQLYQRSADVFIGVPFNIASYSLLLMMMAQVTGLKPGEFVHTLGDAHIYNNHFEQVRTQLERAPIPLPVMKVNPEVRDIDNFVYEDFTLVNYEAWPHIKGEIAV